MKTEPAKQGLERGMRAAPPHIHAELKPRVQSREPPDPPRVVIVGGGLAGLAAAVGLANRDLRITLLESRPRLGGRASSFVDPATGTLVDNCQHVSMACCTNLADFCQRVGTRALFRPLAELRLLAPDTPPTVWKASRLPAPLHLLPSFLKSRFLSATEKLRIMYAMACLRWANPLDPRPFEAWLRAHCQTPRTLSRYWSTVLVSALNERLDQMDVALARKVFLDGFLRNRAGHVVEVPAVPLGELYGRRLESWFADAGIEVRLGTGVRCIDCDCEGAVRGVTLRDGTSLPADFVVVAVPFDRVAGLFNSELQPRLPELKPIDQIASTPITGIHLWFDRDVCPVDHAVVIDKTIQWVFNHSMLLADPGVDGEQYLQLVVSASYDLASLDKAEVIRIACDDLAAFWPSVRNAKLLRSWVVTEHGATFSARPGIDALRPSQRGSIEGLFFAGDWTRTGWPATMEGAVRSGYLAAEGVLGDLGRPIRLLQPDLPVDWLARGLYGKPAPFRMQTRDTRQAMPQSAGEAATR